jgi:hypothetical protein
MNLILIIGLVFGIIISCINFYLSFLAKYFEKGKVGSGIPLIASLLLFISLFFIEDKVLFFIIVFFIVIDTGGIHWFLGTIFYEEVYRKWKK